jgi:hypothetical protein
MGGGFVHHLACLSRRRLLAFCILLPRLELHDWQAGTKLSALFVPPDINGMTWSTVDGPSLPQ